MLKYIALYFVVGAVLTLARLLCMAFMDGDSEDASLLAGETFFFWPIVLLIITWGVCGAVAETFVETIQRRRSRG